MQSRRQLPPPPRAYIYDIKNSLFEMSEKDVFGPFFQMAALFSTKHCAAEHSLGKESGRAIFALLSLPTLGPATGPTAESEMLES